MSDEFRTEQFYPDDYDENEEEEEDGMCGQWISEGTEECDFCPHADACREATFQSQKAQGLISPSKQEKD